jgi:hypothetical protein
MVTFLAKGAVVAETQRSSTVFRAGDIVRRRRDPTCIGIIVSVRPFVVRSGILPREADPSLWELVHRCTVTPLRSVESPPQPRRDTSRRRCREPGAALAPEPLGPGSGDAGQVSSGLRGYR